MLGVVVALAVFHAAVRIVVSIAEAVTLRRVGAHYGCHRARVHKPLDPSAPADRFQHLLAPLYAGVHDALRLASGKVHDCCGVEHDARLLERRVEAARHVELRREEHESAARRLLELTEMARLAGVRGVAHSRVDCVPPSEQRLHDVRSDEARGASDGNRGRH
eukprot:5394526-Prymnesium_polylepis.1